MAKSLCRLLIKVNHAIVANFSVAKMSFYAIRENDIIAKISGFTISRATLSYSSLVVYVVVVKRGQWLSGRVLDSRPKGRGF